MAEVSVIDQDEPSQPALHPFPIAGIGASAGGVKALQDFFGALPKETGAAIVVIIHLDPTHQSELGKVIAARTRLPVQQVERSAPLRPDHVYVIPPNRRLLITNREVSAVEFEEPRGQRAPIDEFFRSLADQHNDGFAIILSGAGSDGTLGVRAVKEAGGIVLVQDPEEAEYNSMPRSVIAAGHADFVLPARDLATQFVELVRNKDRLTTITARHEEDEVLGRILAYLKLRTGHDFSQYKRASVVRRVERRVQVAKTANLTAYLDHLREHPEEVQALFSDLLISVTQFFRDPHSFERLGTIVIPAIFDNMRDGRIRIWVPGCATGEEAYSIAILLLEEAAKRETRPEIQIFATDLDLKALATARDGCYPETLSADIPENRVRRFFTHEGDQYRINREVRDLVVFAQHSVLKDPPFSRLDLISCRNFLIYINRELQQKVVSIFHYALNPKGYLFLGSSENIDHPEGLFRMADRGARIFQSVGRRLGEAPALANLLPHVHLPEAPNFETKLGRMKPVDSHHEHREALAEAAPPSVLVDEMHHVLHLSERAGQYMLHPPGIPTFDVTELVRPELSAELRIMLNRAFEEEQSGISLPIQVQFDDSSRYVCVQASLIKSAGTSPRALVLFIEGGPAQLSLEGDEAPSSDAEVKRLQDELRATRGNLKIGRQQFETATENLRAANEELQSINEEYRSTAEELETSREELQSMNEELQTVNAELESKLDAVSRGRNDLENLIVATDVATLFLDPSLRIKWFTPRVSEVFNISSSDEGRQIGDFTHRLDYPGFDKDVRSVMGNSKKIEKAVRSANGRWFLMNIRPYQTRDGRTEGVVATFVDVTKLRETEDRLRDTEARRPKKKKKRAG